MSKVRTFSRTFPVGHLNQGKPTFFVEKILNSLEVDFSSEGYMDYLLKLNDNNISIGKLSIQDIKTFWSSLVETSKTKNHTIRNGFNIVLGEYISPRVWSKKPYYSPQIIFYDDIKVKELKEFKKDGLGNWILDGQKLSIPERISLSKGDGLDYHDMLSWFKKEIHGQLIIWKI